MWFKPFRKNFINSPKFFIDMIFHNVNLVLLTCIPKFDVPLQVVNRTWFNLIFKEGFEFKIEL
jgi:hypothetical protein